MVENRLWQDTSSLNGWLVVLGLMALLEVFNRSRKLTKQQFVDQQIICHSTYMTIYKTTNTRVVPSKTHFS